MRDTEVPVPTERRPDVVARAGDLQEGAHRSVQGRGVHQHLVACNAIGVDPEVDVVAATDRADDVGVTLEELACRGGSSRVHFFGVGPVVALKADREHVGTLVQLSEEVGPEGVVHYEPLASGQLLIKTDPAVVVLVHHIRTGLVGGRAFQSDARNRNNISRTRDLQRRLIGTVPHRTDRRHVRRHSKLHVVQVLAVVTHIRDARSVSRAVRSLLERQRVARLDRSVVQHEAVRLTGSERDVVCGDRAVTHVETGLGLRDLADKDVTRTGRDVDLLKTGGSQVNLSAVVCADADVESARSRVVRLSLGARESAAVTNARLSVDVANVAGDDVQVLTVPLKSVIIEGVARGVDRHVVGRGRRRLNLRPVRRSGSTSAKSEMSVEVSSADIGPIGGRCEHANKHLVVNSVGRIHVRQHVGLNPRLREHIALTWLQRISQLNSRVRLDTVITHQSKASHLASQQRVHETRRRRSRSGTNVRDRPVSRNETVSACRVRRVVIEYGHSDRLIAAKHTSRSQL